MNLDAAKTVACPKCGANAGQNCTRVAVNSGWLKGRPLRDKVHVERMKEYMKSQSQNTGECPKFELQRVQLFIDYRGATDDPSKFPFQLSAVIKLGDSEMRTLVIVSGFMDDQKDQEVLERQADILRFGVALGKGTEITEVPFDLLIINPTKEENVRTH